MNLGRKFHKFVNEDFGLPAEVVANTMRQVYLRGDRLMSMFISFQLIAAVGHAFAYETWAITIPVTLAAALMFFISRSLLPAHQLTRYAAGVSLQTLVGLHIYQMHGLPEMHFYFFTAQTMLIVYEDWKATWPGTFLIIGQHTFFAILQNTGSPLYFWPESYITVQKLAFHYGIALVQVLVSNYWSILQRRQRLMLVRQRLDLEASRELAEQAKEAKSQFLANMSHEIRTPLNGVLGMAGVLLNMQLHPAQRECVEAIHSSGQSLLSILDDVLDLSKIEAGRLTLEPVEFQLRDVVESVSLLFAPKAVERNLELLVRVDPAAPDRIIGDPTRLRQILLNLTSNAVKFTHQGSVRIEVALMERRASTCRLRFSVTDTGIGIPKQLHSAIFERFSQADASTTRSYGGTGLGLAISQKLVKLMGGSIEVISAPQEGSRFQFDLDFPAPAPTPAKRHLEGARILVAGKAAGAPAYVAELLQSWGATVDVATKPAEVQLGVPYCLAVVEDAALKEFRAFLAASTALLVIHQLNEPAPTGNDSGCLRVRYLLTPVRSALLLESVQELMRGESGSAPATERTPQLTCSGEPPRVLVAEDNLVNQRVATLLLQQLGCAVDIASNGREAVEKWRRQDYDVIFMDCQMPVQDGFQATAEIRNAQNGKSRVPIIALTANAMAGDRERCLAAGMDAYVAKPLSFRNLLTVLRENAPGLSEALSVQMQDSEIECA